MGKDNAGMSMNDVLSRYKASFDQIWSEEQYKWAAVKHYKETWNIDAPDFSAMLAEAFSKAASGSGALLAGAMYYPYKMITAFAQENPETVRAMFRQLYDESRPLAARYTEFRAGCGKCLTVYRGNQEGRRKARNHYQDLRAVSVYLSFEYPDTYFLYKYKMYSQFRDLIGYPEAKEQAKSELWKLEAYNRLCQDVLRAIQQDKALLQMQKDVLDERFWPDETYHLLTQTVIYEGSFMELPSEGTVDLPAAEEEPETHGQPVTDVAKNTILYGPPGTGKTYHTVFYAVAAIENKPLASVQAEQYSAVLARYQEHKAAGRIEFTTFHQSYGYEEFIEGIRPVMQEEEGDRSEVEYQIVPGLFKRFCDKAGQPVLRNERNLGLNSDPVVWKVSLDGTGENKVRTECMENGHIRIGWDEYGPSITDETNYYAGGKSILNAFLNKMRIGDIVLSCYSASAIDAVGVVTGEYEWHDEYEYYKRLRPVKWLVKGIQKNILAINNGTNMTLATVYRLGISVSDVLEIVREYAAPMEYVEEQKQNHVFLIDEINRGNISKIFGELITLIEPSKRIGQPEGMTLRLPYSKREFGVPDNVYLIGTMNTADRSIAAIDTALRRRFQFREMQPDPKVLAGISVEDISIQDMLTRMNEKIRVLYDREHTIGHAYFMPLVKSPTIETLAGIFEHSILPLLQEYFCDDYEKIRLVLGDNNKREWEDQFILASTVDCGELFGSTDVDLDGGFQYEINKNAFDNIEAYRSI